MNTLISMILVRFQVLTAIEYVVPCNLEEVYCHQTTTFKSKKQWTYLQSQCKVHKYLKLTLMKGNEVHHEIRKVSTGSNYYYYCCYNYEVQKLLLFHLPSVKH